MPKTRAIRLSDIEDKKISQFLKQNSFFDFSSLARTAIMNFIQSPTVSIRPISMQSEATSRPRKKSNVEVFNETT